jgi:Holliday junction resolvasome RuvABC endonuclease subunit
MNNLKILREWDVNDSIHAFAVESPYSRPSITRYGIDPGTVNMGIACVHTVPNVSILLYQVKMVRGETIKERIRNAHDAFTRCRLTIDPNAEVVIEGAGYSKHYRQVEMEDVRAATVMWFDRYGIECHVVPPNTIRKQVFGNGREKNPWENLPNDVAAALGCAYYDSNKTSNISS